MENAETNETTVVAENYERGDNVVEFDPNKLTADLLYELVEEMEMVQDEVHGARLELERQNMVAYDGYIPKLTVQDASTIAISLVVARGARQELGHDHRIEYFERFGEALLDAKGNVIDERISDEVTLRGVKPEYGHEIFVVRALLGEQEFSQRRTVLQDVVDDETEEEMAPDMSWMNEEHESGPYDSREEAIEDFESEGTPEALKQLEDDANDDDE